MPAPRHLLFLPGITGDPDFWRPVADRLPADWHKACLAWPGLGAQPADPSVSSFDDLVALTEAHLPDRPADIIAQSMGGLIALRLALKSPHRLSHLVLAATSGGIDVTSLGATDWRPDFLSAYPNTPPWALQPTPNLEADLAKITLPTLLLWATDDPISPLKVGQTLQACLPNAHLETLVAHDHGFAHRHPDAIATFILSALTK